MAKYETSWRPTLCSETAKCFLNIFRNKYQETLINLGEQKTEAGTHKTRLMVSVM